MGYLTGAGRSGMTRGRGRRSLGEDVERIIAAVGSVAFDGAWDGSSSGALTGTSGPQNGAPCYVKWASWSNVMVK